MDSGNTLITGIAPEHVPALVAALLVLPALPIGLRLLRGFSSGGSSTAAGLLQRWEAASYLRRLTAGLLLTTGVVHLALPLGHHDAPGLTLLFWAAGIAFVVLAIQSLGGGRWRFRSKVLLIASIAAYLAVAGSGWQEEPDQVGIATKFIELAAFGLIAAPQSGQAHRGLGGRMRHASGTLGFVLLTVTTGVVIWVGSFIAHTTAAADAVEAHEHEPGTALHSHETNGHSHTFAARAQAGVILRPISSEPPTPAQVEAAVRLAEETKAGVLPYMDYEAALASGYKPEGPKLGLQRHLKNKAYAKDGVTLDPKRPELLVFATMDDRHFYLLGVAYTMEKAGQLGPAVGGSLTRWHAHNVCVTLLPPAFGLVSPFGSCPVGAVAVTLPEMMHVWTVDNPHGPYAENLDDKWVRKLIAASNQPE